MADSASMGSSTVDNIPNAEDMKDGNKWHRVIKHRDVNILTKYVMGLETYHNYYFRSVCSLIGKDCIFSNCVSQHR